MNNLHKTVWKWIRVFLFSMFSLLFFSTTSAWATSASLSTNTISISSGETGSFTISGNDDGKDEYQFRWDIPSGLNVSKGSSSNLKKFEIDWDKMRIKVESDARGSFSATVRVSANNNGTFVLENTRAEINLNPADVTISVGGSGGGTGGGTTEPPPADPPPDGGGTSGTGNADYTLYIETGFVSVGASPETGNGATTIPSWGYTLSNGGNGRFPGAILESVEGGSFTVEVVNNHNRNHNFVIQGVTSDTTSISPGGSRTYTVNTPTAGVYLYRDTLNNNVNRALGLFGGLVVRTADGSQRAWSNGPSFDQERLWVINDLDRPRWTERAFNGNSVNTSVYRPNYFFMNGLNGFAGMGDANSTLEGNVGDVFLVRIVNAGQFDQSLHFHSNHFQVLSRGGNREGSPPWQDTINVRAGSTATVLYRLNQPGHYPMHVHTAQMETGNGVYLNGTATMIIAH